MLQRRTILQAFAAAAAGAALVPAASLTSAEAAEATKTKKAIVIVFSRTGSTEKLARWIAEETGADFLKLELVDPYADDYGGMTNIAREERTSGKRREIKTTIPDLSGYDTVWLGSPYWWGGYSVPMLTFLRDHPLEGKRVHPFCVSASSSPDGAWSDLAKLCPKAERSEGFWVRERGVDGAREALAAWIRKNR